jgi:hypothetical protein
VGDRVRDITPTSSTKPATTDLTEQGSPGAFLVRGLGGWSSPAFFSVALPNDGRESQDGYAGKPLVMVFTTERAAQTVSGCATGTCSLSALKVTSYSDNSGSSSADVDVVVWTPDMQSSMPMRGEQVSFRDLGSNAFYNNRATLWQILNDAVTTERTWPLQTALLTRVAPSRR